jgi:hypothetical protein
MADYAAPNNAIETRADLGTDPGGVVAFWLQQLKLAEREDRNFIKRGRKIVQRYRNEWSASCPELAPLAANALKEPDEDDAEAEEDAEPDVIGFGEPEEGSAA